MKKKQKQDIPRPKWKTRSRPKPLWQRFLLGIFEVLTIFGGGNAVAPQKIPQFIRPLFSRVRIQEAEAAEGEETRDQTAIPSSRTHTVESGETLWMIAEAAYGQGERWIDIWQANRDHISDYNLIFTGQELHLPDELIHRDNTQILQPARQTSGQTPTDIQANIVATADHLVESLVRLAETHAQNSPSATLQPLVEEAIRYTESLHGEPALVAVVDSTSSLLDVAREAVAAVENTNPAPPSRVASGIIEVDSSILSMGVGTRVGASGGNSSSTASTQEVPAISRVLANTAEVVSGPAAGEVVATTAMGVTAHVVAEHGVTSSSQSAQPSTSVSSQTENVHQNTILQDAANVITQQGSALVTQAVADAAGVSAADADNPTVQTVALQGLTDARTGTGSAVPARTKSSLPRLSPRLSPGTDTRSEGPSVTQIIPSPSAGDIARILPFGSGSNIDLSNVNLHIPGTEISFGPFVTMGLGIAQGLVNRDPRSIANSVVQGGLNIASGGLTPSVVSDAGISGAGAGAGFEGGAAAGTAVGGEAAAAAGTMTAGQVLGAFASPAGVIIISGIIELANHLMGRDERRTLARRADRYREAVGMTGQMIVDTQNSSTPEDLMRALRIGNTEDPTLVFREGYVTSPQIQSDDPGEFRRALQDLEHLDIRLVTGNLGPGRDASAMNTALTNAVRAQAYLIRLADQGNSQAIGILQARRDDLRRFNAALNTIGDELLNTPLAAANGAPVMRDLINILSYIYGASRIQAAQAVIGIFAEDLGRVPDRQIPYDNGFRMVPTRVDELNLLDGATRSGWESMRDRYLRKTVDAYRILGGNPSENALRWLRGGPVTEPEVVVRTIGGQPIPENAVIGEDGTVSIADSDGTTAIGIVDPLPPLPPPVAPAPVSGLRPVSTLIDEAIPPSKVPQTSAVNPALLIDHAIRVSGYQPTAAEAASALAQAETWLGQGISANEVTERLVGRGRALAAAQTPQAPQSPGVSPEIATAAAPGLVEAAIKASGYTPNAADREEAERAARELLQQGVSRGEIVARLTEIGRQRIGTSQPRQRMGEDTSSQTRTPPIATAPGEEENTLVNTNTEQHTLTIAPDGAFNLRDLFTPEEISDAARSVQQGQVSRAQIIDAILGRGGDQESAEDIADRMIELPQSFILQPSETGSSNDIEGGTAVGTTGTPGAAGASAETPPSKMPPAPPLIHDAPPALPTEETPPPEMPPPPQVQDVPPPPVAEPPPTPEPAPAPETVTKEAPAPEGKTFEEPPTTDGA